MIKSHEYKRLKNSKEHNKRGSKIYSLSDPVTGKIFYIGCTIRPLHKRYSEHINGHMSQHGRHKQSIIDNLINEGYEPVVDIMYEFSCKEKARLVEKYLINFYSNFSYKCELSNSMNMNTISENI